MTQPQPIGAPFDATDAQRLHRDLVEAAVLIRDGRERLLSVNAGFRDTPAELHEWIADLTTIQREINAAAAPLETAIFDALEEEAGT